MEQDKKITYYIYKDDQFMKNIYTQLFDEMPDVGAIEFIGSKSTSNSVNYTIVGDRDKSKNKNFELEDTEKNINRNVKNQIRGEVGYRNNFGEEIIRIYANIEDIKYMLNNGLYDNIVKRIKNLKCSEFEELIHIQGKMKVYDNYNNQQDIFIDVNGASVWLKKDLLDTDIKTLEMILDNVNVVGLVVKGASINSPQIIKAIAIYR